MGRQGNRVRCAGQAPPASWGARRTLARVVCSGFAVVVAGIPVAAQQPGADGPSKALEGRWALELYLDSPSARFSPMAGQINGEIAFSNTAWWNPRDRFGRHSLDLQSFFGRSFLRPAGTVAFGPADTSMVTEVSGNVHGDSLTIDFIPRVDHGGVSMWGRFFGDSAKGKWDRRGADGDGHFVLRRLSKEPVSVAAIPDGRPVAVAAAPAKPLTKAEQRAKAKADALAKAKAADSARTVARAEARAKARTDSLARAQARDSARAVAAAAATAKKDSLAQVAAATKATRDSAARVAKARKDSTAQVAAARKDSIAQVAQAKRDSAAAARVASRTTTATARTAATATAAPNATPAVASALASTPAGTTGGSGASTATATVAAAGAPNGTGPAPLRVRAYDIASNTYFSTKYSLHLPDGHWLYGTLKTGSAGEGYGPAVVRPPGTYEIEVTDFMCGDKVWFLKNKILKKVVIAPGTPTDVTIDVNLATEPARPSLENKEGATCSSAPGAVR